MRMHILTIITDRITYICISKIHINPNLNIDMSRDYKICTSFKQTNLNWRTCLFSALAKHCELWSNIEHRMPNHPSIYRSISTISVHGKSSCTTRNLRPNRTIHAPNQPNFWRQRHQHDKVITVHYKGVHLFLLRRDRMSQ